MRIYNMRNTLLATTALAFLTATPSVAQTMNYGSLEMMFGEPVTTAATGSPQKASEAPVTMEIITADDIKRSGASSIADIVSRVAGVNMLHSTAQGSDIAVRGYNEPLEGRMLVLVNGRQVYIDFFGFTDWSALPVRLEEIQQIEVVKGPNTALFGFNAAAGVINIVTYNPAYDDKSAVTMRGGSQGSYEASGAATYKFAPGSGIRLSGGYSKQDEWSQGSNQPELTALPGGKVMRSTPSLNTVAAEGVFTVADGTQLITEVTSTLHDYNVESSPGYGMGALWTRTQSYKGELVSNTPVGLVTAQVYDNATQANFDSLLPISANLLVAQLQDLFKLGASTTIRVSGEYRTNSLKSLPDQSGTVSYDVYSGGVMAEHKLSSSYTLTGAVRFDNLNLGRTGTFPNGVPQTNAMWDRTIDEVSYNFGLVGQLNADNTLRLTTARGLQLPSLFNLSVLDVVVAAPAPVYTGAAILANPNLNATVVTNYELGWDLAITDTAKMRWDVFYQTNDNINSISNFNVLPPDYTVARAPFPALLVGSAEPIGNSDVKGLEGSFKNSLASGFNYGVNFAYLDVTDSLTSTYLRRVDYKNTTPTIEANANLGWTNGTWTADAYLKYVGKANGFVSSTVANVNGVTVVRELSIPAYVNVDARIAYLIRKGVTFDLEGRNMFQNNATQTAGYLVPSTYLAGVRVDF
jgi:outer membrane receptor for ferrienterochelin and colicins